MTDVKLGGRIQVHQSRTMPDGALVLLGPVGFDAGAKVVTAGPAASGMYIGELAITRQQALCLVLDLASQLGVDLPIELTQQGGTA